MKIELKIRKAFEKIINVFYDPTDPHCGGCTINCSLYSPNCRIGRDKAKVFFTKHPELKAEKIEKE